MNTLLFILAYYIVWFGSLILAAAQLPWIAFLLSISMSLAQLIFLCDLSQIQKTWKKFFLCLTFIGFSVDSVLCFSSYIHFEANPWQPYLAPPWILGIWISFSVLCIGISTVIQQLSNYLWIIALMGFPAAYLVGVSFNAAVFVHGTSSSLLLGFIWMLLFPLVCRSTL